MVVKRILFIDAQALELHAHVALERVQLLDFHLHLLMAGLRRGLVLLPLLQVAQQVYKCACTIPISQSMRANYWG